MGSINSLVTGSRMLQIRVRVGGREIVITPGINLVNIFLAAIKAVLLTMAIVSFHNML